MRRVLMTSLAILGLVLALAVPAMAQKIVGGHDETTENHTGVQWAAAAPATPKAGPAVAGTHLLITEVGWRGTNSTTAAWADSTEFFEIYNPTSEIVDLSNYYVSDVNGYSALPVAGTIDIAASGTDFAFRFPAGATIAPGAYKSVAIQGQWFKKFTGLDADYMLFNMAGQWGSTPTTAVLMIDVSRNKPAQYPTFGEFTNGGEFLWLFYWDQISDLVCDIDLVYWGAPTGANLPTVKTTLMCQDGPDADALPSCYFNDAGPLTSARALTTPASGAGTRQRVTAEGAETLTGGNGCIPGGPTAAQNSTWGNVKALYR